VSVGQALVTLGVALISALSVLAGGILQARRDKERWELQAAKPQKSSRSAAPSYDEEAPF
jgi:hypothetical protein